jgi:hypothetical protein
MAYMYSMHSDLPLNPSVTMAVPEVTRGFHSVFSTTDSTGNKLEVCTFNTITESVVDRPQCSSSSVVDGGSL